MLHSLHSNRHAKNATILVVLGGDGDVEVYTADPKARVYVASRPYLPTGQGEILGDEYLDVTLPTMAKPLFEPGNLRARGQCQKTTPAELLQREIENRLIEQLRKLSKSRKDTSCAPATTDTLINPSKNWSVSVEITD